MSCPRSERSRGSSAAAGPADARAAELFDALAEDYLGDPAVSRARLFGMSVLKTGNRVFAALADGQLVVKLPADQIDALLASGLATRFRPFGGHKEMREWVAVPPDGAADWPALTEAARRFVGG
jgi:hypothetical protein